MELNSNQIEEIIPHRYPFLLVDRITDMKIGEYGVGLKAVSANEMHFQGHFPGHHVMPGVLIVEALAQVGAVTILSMDEYKGKIALFAGIKNMKFRRQVVPGDVLELRVDLTKMKRGIGYGDAVATVNGEVAAKGELTFAIQ
ncbi:3-hydroxyacyl-ACP dehydratase FabZ [Mollicutes bacterium LVI A0078]|nr:3-hydroxyacyl-ACP dehydratase FabZ [Mollicutes bacterium LVI A0075]WOO91802.1 3-hydroxyacyl-ACP dehydratase FabZ [Mollicutes bacterium LVI A0078]